MYLRGVDFVAASAEEGVPVVLPALASMQDALATAARTRTPALVLLDDLDDLALIPAPAPGPQGRAHTRDQSSQLWVVGAGASASTCALVVRRLLQLSVSVRHSYRLWLPMPVCFLHSLL
jgi:hypothetical protein